MGGCRNYDSVLGTVNIRCHIIYNRDPNRDHNFDNHPNCKTSYSKTES